MENEHKKAARAQNGKHVLLKHSTAPTAPLYSVIEQKSAASLHDPTLLWHSGSSIEVSQGNDGFAAAGLRRKETNDHVVRQRHCFSLDETTDHRHHNAKTFKLTSDNTISSAERSPHRFRGPVPEPAQPPFQPPERVTTPDGLPSWRGQQADRAAIELAIRSARPRSIFQQLRSSSSRAFGHVFGLPGPQSELQQRMWRPPVSGHSTARFADIGVHPLANAPFEVGESSVARSDGTDQCMAVGGSDEQRARSKHGGPRIPHERDWQARGYDHGSYLGPSLRALQAANGNAVIVSSQRARSHAEASQTWRSVSLPTSQLRSPSSASVTTLFSPALNATTSTARLIEQFPLPPEDAFAGPQNTSDHQRFPLPWPMPRAALPFSRADGSGSRSGLKRSRYGLPAPPPEEPTADTSARTPSATAQALSRRSSHNNTNVWNCTRTESALTGSSRYFSGSSTPSALHDVVSAHAIIEREQERRAVENGALRFAARASTDDVGTTTRATHRLMNHENDVPNTPVITSSSMQVLCPHGRLVTKQHHFNLDGTSASPTPATQSTQTTTFPQSRRSVVLDADSVRPHEHLTHYSPRPTWRTRMRRVKCWRCELEARRATHTIPGRHRYRTWKEWRASFIEKLRWTCFCGYVAYDDESDDDNREAEIHERARLGRMGVELA